MEPLLPISPAAHLGRVIHRILESADRGKMAGELFEARWSEFVEQEESKMREAWFERHLVPLRDHTRLYDLKKEQCRASAEQAYDLLATRPRDYHGGRSKHEVKLQTPDCRIVGRADAIVQKDGRTTIVDFKSGSLLKHDDTEEHGARDDYVRQLKLYAALYHAERGQLPDALRIVGLDGESVEVPFNLEECRQLLGEARTMLSHINCIVPRGFRKLRRHCGTPRLTLATQLSHVFIQAVLRCVLEIA